MNPIKKSYIILYKQCCKKRNVSKLSRDCFCSSSKVSKHKIEKLFGSYTNFVLECNKFEDNSNLDNNDNDHNEFFSQISDNCSFNTRSGEYRFDFTNKKNIGKLIVLPKTQVYAILQAYSNYDGSKTSISKIANIQNLSKYIVKSILQELEMTHDSLPITDQDIASSSEDEVVEDLLNTVRGNVYHKFQKKLWEDQIIKANKWDLFEAKKLNPYRDILNNWNPPKLDFKIPNTKCNHNNSFSYVVTISDLHFGAKSNKELTYWSDQDWDMESICESVDNYIKSIDNNLNCHKIIPQECYLLSLGDIIHSISGFTDKNTPLEYDIKGPLLFKQALDSLSKLIAYLSLKFNHLYIESVSGNHDSFGDWVLFMALKLLFKNKSNISWKISTERWNCFTIGQNLVLMEHGYSPFFKSKVPNGKTATEAYIQRLIIKELKNSNINASNIKNSYFFMGDRHHYTAKDFPTFEFIQLPTCVGGDLYADHLNVAGTRNKQCTFIFDKYDGLVEAINHYI